MKTLELIGTTIECDYYVRRRTSEAAELFGTETVDGETYVFIGKKEYDHGFGCEVVGAVKFHDKVEFGCAQIYVLIYRDGGVVVEEDTGETEVYFD